MKIIMIEFNILTKERINIERGKEVISKVLELEKQSTTFDISVALISEEEIKKINNKYRKINKATDVLSFEGDDEKYLGEILICLNEVFKNGNNSEDELKRILIHGTLHLLGYDHEKDKGEMLLRQEKYVSLI